MPRVNISYTEDYFVDPATGKSSYITRPFVKIRLKYNHKIDKFPTVCLLDSGADRNLFPSQWGQVLGINIYKGVERTHTGIGGTKLTSYTHNVGLYFGSYLFQTEVDFSDIQIFSLPGRVGFFKYFKSIVFDEENKTLRFDY